MYLAGFYVFLFSTTVSEECLSIPRNIPRNHSRVMSSPPTSLTSEQATKLSRRHNQRSYSFPSFGSFYLSRPKPPKPPKPSTPHISSDRFVVAAGIFNTDATGKVFGYLDSEDLKKSGSKTTVFSFDGRTSNQTPEHSTNPIKKLIGRYKEAWEDDGTDDFCTRTHRRHIEAFDRGRQERRDDAKRQREENEKRERRGRRMRTVSKDDELIERGANPRTGLVSPFVLSDGSGDSANGGYVAKVHQLAARGRKGGSGKRKQNSQGWCLVEGPLLSPIAQSVNEEGSRAVSAKHLDESTLSKDQAWIILRSCK